MRKYKKECHPYAVIPLNNTRHKQINLVVEKNMIIFKDFEDLKNLNTIITKKLLEAEKENSPYHPLKNVIINKVLHERTP